MALALFWTVAVAPGAAQYGPSDGFGRTGGGAYEIGANDALEDVSEIDTLHPQMVAEARRLGMPVADAADASPEGSGDLFQYPLRMSTRTAAFNGEMIANHVDHDAGSGLEDFACGTRTYNGHNGIDIVLFPYRWDMMDRREMAVVAAMGGTVVRTHDGEFDRQCSIVDAEANHVILRHDNGLLAYYWHLKKGTVAKLAPGARVSAGQVLGYVGSSGTSTAPHLHFELRGSGNALIDPWKGKCNKRPTSWAHQSPTIDTRIIRVATHDIQPPAPSSGCDSPEPGYSDGFGAGETLWAAAYMRDQTPEAKARLEVLRPDGSRAAAWTTGAPSSGFLVASYWWGAYTLPADAPAGQWAVRATLDGEIFEHAFKVGGKLKSTSIRANITSRRARTVRAGKRTHVYAEIENRGRRAAFGCRASAGRPLSAAVEFREIDPATRKPVKAAGETLRIAAGAIGYLRVTVTPDKGFRAQKAAVAIQFDCANARAAPYSRRKTRVVLTAR